ncbi:gamma-glutamylputrescine oxidase [Cognatiyoonia koreensis]|uniref:Gamma-glutamylputrescine oxidase n=1 Tax=Cognatiyoonia koreensis TaxID=364200 RepID=A0A1I0Q7D2_9RHOB|nr:FAD-binding oxidoreductase [Cognatiyoonia koreensis]SEW22718.1 gamma-glutamylputrescine oxidase [Cognatiyoonia koreensis]
MNPLFRNDRRGEHAPSWYADSADIPPQRPALKGQETADVCVVGAGFTGLTAALRLADRGMKVIVLEAHRAGFGASGRNGGQVGSGFNQSQQWIARKLGDGPARALWEMAEEAKADLRTLAPPEARFTPGVAHGAYTEAEVDEDKAAAEYLAETYRYTQIATLDKTAIQDLIRTKSYVGGVLDMGAGHIHPLRYVLSLAKQAESAGATIFEGSDVHHIAQGDPAKVQTGQGHVIARHVILAGNGYLPNIAPQVNQRVMPINSFICATEPLGKRAAEILTRDIAVADSKFVVNYFRLSEDKRLLFGGRESYGIGFPKDISTKLVSRMCTLFPQLKGVPITHVWGGTLGITMSRLPAVQRITPNVLSAAGFSGHGVALSGFAGKLMAEAVVGQAERFDVMASLPTPAFPGGTLARAPLLTLAMTWYAMRDRLGI